MNERIRELVAKWDYFKFEDAYWEPLIKRKLVEDELNAIDVAHLKAVFQAGAEAALSEPAAVPDWVKREISDGVAPGTYAPDEPPAMSDPLKPSLTLLMKLGSLIVHYEEFISAGRHEFDLVAINTLCEDSEVQSWIKAMDKMALLPKKR